VDEVEEEAIAGALIQEGLDREVHGSVPPEIQALRETFLKESQGVW